MPEGEAHVERILLEVSAPAEGLESQSSGLNLALSQLNALEGAIRRVEASYNGLMASMRGTPSSGSAGGDPAFMGQMRLFEQRREAMEQAARRQSTGSIQLDVPAGQITAFVSGQVQLVVHGEQIRATVAGTVPLQSGSGAGGSGGGGSTVGGFTGGPAGGSGRILLSTREQAGRSRQRFLVGDATGRHIETVDTLTGAGGTTETRTTRESFEKRDALQRGTFRTDQDQVRRDREAERIRSERSEERRLREGGFSGQRIAPGFNIRGAVEQQRQFNRYIDDSRRAHDEAAKAAARFEESTRFIGRNLLKNVAHVTAWAASVAILYGSINLVTGAMSKMVEVQYQSARLSQVLRSEYEGNSTATRKLTDDVLRMASANGRDSKEAMESAIQWARLGYNRVQVAEAVRVSLVAANVAEISAAEATDHLSSLTAVYGLKVSELNDVLGMLNATSNTYNATNADLLTGLTKTAAVAKQAGIPLAELIGLLGAGIGGTGQSGANIGNAIKSITGSLNNKDTQQLLRNSFQIETTSQGGEGIEKMPEILANIFVAYQKMNEAERQSMIYSVAGKNQASRMAAILDNYVRSQVLAVNAQLNLNSAELENVRIKETLRAQLAGLVTEWTRFVNAQGNQSFGPAAGLTEATKLLTNALRLANTGVGSVASTGAIALLGALAAKMTLTAFQMKNIGEKGSFAMQTVKALKGAYGDMVTVLDKSISSSPRWVQALAGTSAAAERGAGSAGLMRKAFAGAVGALVDFLPQLLLIAGAIYLINQAMDALGFSSDRSNQKIDELTQRGQAAKNAGEAGGTSARLFRTSQDAINNSNTTEGRVAIARGAAEAAFPGLTGDEKRARVHELQNELELMIRQGDIQGANAKLEDHALEAISYRASKRQEEYELIRKQNQEHEKEIDRLEHSLVGWDKVKKVEEIRGKIRANNDKRTGMAVEDMNDPAESLNLYEKHDDRHKAFLGQQKGLIEGIKEIYTQLPQDSYTDKLQTELQMQTTIRDVMQQKLDIVEQQMRATGMPMDVTSMAEVTAQRQQLAQRREDISDEFFNATGLKGYDEEGIRGFARLGGDKTSVGPAARRAMAEYQKLKPIEVELDKMDRERLVTQGDEGRMALLARRKDLKEKIDDANQAIASGNIQAGFAATADKSAVALRLAAARSRSFGVGDGAGQQFVAQMNGTANEAARTQFAAMGQSGDDRHTLMIQALQHRIQLTEMLVHGEEMLRDLGREELNLLTAKNREYQRQTLTMGPAELLRRMAVNQLGANGRMNSGRFFSMDAGARNDFLSRPENSEEVLENRRSQAALRGAGFGSKTDKEIQDRYARAAADRNAMRSELRPISPIEFPQAAYAAVALKDLTTSASALKMEFKDLADRVSTMFKDLNPGPQAHTMQRPAQNR